MQRGGLAPGSVKVPEPAKGPGLTLPLLRGSDSAPQRLAYPACSMMLENLNSRLKKRPL